jgi:alkyl sulfatase BDS1-like metallo-beta-lactamase superfamily hydrolase
MNAGLTPSEIAEEIELPEPLARQWFNRGYYGTMSHNAKAVYQRYLGWYDGNPANLNPLPPEPAGRRYIAAMGGAEAVRALAEAAIAQDDLRWAATLLNHLVFADETAEPARRRLAEVYTRMAFAAEAGTWRNIYLTGAQELTDGPARLPPAGFSPDVLAATTTSMLLDFASVRVDPVKAAARAFRLNLELTDRHERHLITVGDGVLVHEAGIGEAAAEATAHISRPALVASLFGPGDAAQRAEASGARIRGDTSVFLAFLDLIQPLVANFPIVTP